MQIALDELGDNFEKVIYYGDGEWDRIAANNMGWHFEAVGEEMNSDGDLFRHTFRSSLWQRMQHGWQLRFHQGTPTSAFVQHRCQCGRRSDGIT